MQGNLFPTRHLCVLTLVTQKLQDIYKRCTYWMTALLSEISIFCVRAGWEIWLMSYGSKNSLQYFPISHLCVLTCITWKLQVISRCSACRMSALLSNTFLVWFSVVRDNWRATALDTHRPFSGTNLCVDCKPIYTLVFGAQPCMTIETHVPYDCISHTERRLYCQQCIVSLKQSWLATLHVAVSFQLIVYANITTVYTALQVCC